jgi:redox-sensing transcriptional repressor
MSPRIEPQIPDVILERLALYHCLLQEWLISYRNKPITSKDIAEILGFTDETVRRDLSFLKKTGGKPGVGYDPQELYDILGKILDIEERLPIIFVGKLSLLESLTDVFNFVRFGFFIECIYSDHPDDVGKIYLGFKVKSLDELKPDDIPPNCRLAVVMVQNSFLNYTMKKLKEAGIKGILNFTPSVVNRFPEGIEGIQLRYPCYLKVLQHKTKEGR